MPQIRIITSKSGDPSHVGVSGLVRSTGNQNTPNIVKIIQASGVGPQGAAGPEGGTGPQGVQGETGPQGLQGIQGPTGATGPQGDVGVTGPQGDAGITGETGNTGDVGITGPQGNTGDTGNQGPRGSTGPGATVGSAEYTYTSGALAGNATSNGEFLHNTSGNQSVSIFKFDNSGADNRDILAAAASSGSSGRVEIKFGDSITPRIFAFNIVTYDGTKFNFTPTRILPGSSAGSGKKIFVSVHVDNSVSTTARSFASDFFEFSDGTTAGTVVTSWNGETGDVVFDDYVSSVNGQTGAVTIEPGGVTSFNGLTGAVVGVSSVNGLTGAVTVSGGGGATLAAGAGVTLSSIVAGVGYTLGIDPTAVIHVAGVSSDGGITASGNIKTSERLVADVVQSEDDVNSRYGFEINDTIFSVYTGNNDPRARIDSTGIHAENGRIKANTFVEAGTYVHAGTGVSLDAGGITFPDGTFQSTAASGIAGATGATGPAGPAGQDGAGGGGATLAAGAGVTLSSIVAGVGYTLGIDPTAVIHVAGISADGGVTFGDTLSVKRTLTVTNGSGSPAQSIVIPTGGIIKNSQTSSYPYFRIATNELSFVSKSTGTPGKLTLDNTKLFVENVPLISEELIQAQSGISMDASGITFPDGTFQSSAASGSTITAGAGMTLAGSTLGIDPTAAIHVAGITSDGNLLIPNGNYFGNDTHGTVRIASNRVEIKPNNSSTNQLVVRNTETRAHQIVVTEKGISMDAAGITFADGTFQSSAASGSEIVAGAGMTLAGSTLGIDPTASIHVAGVSADGAVVESNAEFRDPTGFGIKKVSGSLRLTYGSGASEYAATVNSSAFSVYEPFICTQTGEFRKKLWLYEGISMDAAGITFPDGTFQSSAASGSTITAGAGMTLTGSTLGIDPTAAIHVAGISSDGGITVDGIVNADRIFGGVGNPTTGILLDGGLNNFYINTSGASRMKVHSSAVIAYVKLQADELFHAKAGISMDAAGITFADGTFQSTAPTGSTITAGAGMTLAGSTLGIDPTAIVHVAGISADGGITASGRFINDGGIVQTLGNVGSRYGYINGSNNTADTSKFKVYVGNNTPFLTVSTNGVDSGARVKAGTYVQSGSYVHAGTGVSLDAGGITFPDGTFQSSAASGSGVTAGAGMVLTGSTLGIDPTAAIHVAGISSDGGATFGAGIFVTGGNIVGPNRVTGRVITDVVQSPDNTNSLYGYKNNNSTWVVQTGNSTAQITVFSGGVQSAAKLEATTFVEAGTYVHAGTGISLDAGGITFADGTFQSSAASGSGGSSTQKYSMGFFYDGRGSNLSTGYISDIVRNVEQGATATKVTVYYPTAVTATAGVELYKVGTTYFNSPGASFEANGTLIAGVSVDSGDYGASAGIAVALSEDDMVFGRLTNSGHTDKLQIFLKYESSS